MADLEDELLDFATGGRRRQGNGGKSATVRKPKKKQVARDSSEDDEDEEEEERSEEEEEESDEQGSGGRRPRGRVMPLKKRFEMADKEEDDDAGGGDGYESDLSFGSDLYKDEDDRQNLAAMTELDREMLLTERADRLEEHKERRRLREEARQRDAPVKDTNKAKGGRAPPPAQRARASSTREAARSREKESALNELVARRNKAQDDQVARRKQRTARRRGVSESPSPKRRGRARPEKDYEPSESEEAESDGDRDSDLGTSRESPAGRGGEAHHEAPSEEEKSDEEDDRKREPDAKIEHLDHIVLRRNWLEKRHQEPFFDDVVKGCLLRLSIGTSRSGVAMYRIVEVVDVDPEGSNRPYKFGKGETRRMLKCKWGVAEKRFSMELVSNHHAAEEEWQAWLAELDKHGLRRFTVREAKEKREHLQKAESFQYTSDAVKAMLEEKKRNRKLPHNMALERERLRKELTLAQERKDEDAVADCKERLEKFEELVREHAAKDDKYRKAEWIKRINAKNLQSNFKQDAERLKIAGKGSADYDPFSRRWTRSQNYWSSKAKEAAEQAIMEGEVGGGGVVKTPKGAATPANVLADGGGDDALVQVEAPRDMGAGMMSTHNFSIEIDLSPLASFQASAAGQGASAIAAAMMARKRKLEETCGVQVGKEKAGRHSLVLTVNDYRRRRGLL